MKAFPVLISDDWKTVYDSEREMLVSLLGILRDALIERGLDRHAIFARVERALASGDIGELRRALEAWKSLPLRVRTDLLRS